MEKAGALDLNRVVNILYGILLIAMLLFTPTIVGVIDSNRARLGYEGDNKVAVNQPQEFHFNVSTGSQRVELLHPNLYENAKWKEIIEITSDFTGVGLNLTIREKVTNKITYYLSNNGNSKFYDVYADFHILEPGDRLELISEQKSGCIDCVSLTFYDIWNFTGTSGDLLAKFSVEVMDWGENLGSIIIAWLVIIVFIGLLWTLTRKSIQKKGLSY